MPLKLGIQHLALKFYKGCSSDDPSLTFDLFTQRSTLVPGVFARDTHKWWVTKNLVKCMI